jgi:D-alanyl-D-alanine carboxypeptidase
MIRFDPLGLTSTLTAGAEQLRGTVDAPAVLVQIEQGALNVRAASGVRDLETGRAAGANQTFEIGSQTKMLTAVAILQLVQAGKIDLDTKASDYLPAETVAGVPNADTTTVRQMLNMTAGLPNYTEAVDKNGIPLFVNELLEKPNVVFGPEEALKIARGMDATGAPGDAFYYSNTNYLMLGQIIENLTGKSFFKALQDGIFDPLGMNDTVRQLGTSDPRLSSYLEDPDSGELIDVTRALWEMRGEAGIASTTGDMITFLKALLVDKTLLDDAALTEMTTMIFTGGDESVNTFFGLGLVELRLTGSHTYIGFTGGTLGTGTSTYLDVDTGTIISLAGTSEAIDTALGGLQILQALEAASGGVPKDDGGPLRFVSGSAADLRLAGSTDGVTFALGGAALTLDRDLRALTTGTVEFKDGSVVVVGDDKAGTAGDERANSVDIARDFSKAAGKNNQLIGLGGDDTLAGAGGNDMISGSAGGDSAIGRAGNDRLWGGSGDDNLRGGNGDDCLVGGSGRDALTGGGGADRFVFRMADAGSVDRIADFEQGSDLISLRAISGQIEGGFRWIDDVEFSGTASQIRMEQVAAGIQLQVDIDADGAADLVIQLRGTSDITARDLLF